MLDRLCAQANKVIHSIQPRIASKGMDNSQHLSGAAQGPTRAGMKWLRRAAALGHEAHSRLDAPPVVVCCKGCDDIHSALATFACLNQRHQLHQAF